MKVDAWQEWLIIATYDIAQLVFLVAAILLVLRTKRLPAYFVALGFALFLVGNRVLLDASRDMAEAEQRKGEVASIQLHELVGSVLSSVGFLGAGLSLVWFAMSERTQEGRDTSRLNGP